MDEQNDIITEELVEDYTLECNRLQRILRTRVPIVLIAISGFIVINFLDANRDFNPVRTQFFLILNIIIVVLATVIYYYSKSLTPEKKEQKRYYRKLRVLHESFDLLSVVPYLMFIVSLSNAFFFSFSPISGTSMEPNFHDNETVIFSHRVTEFERFDVIILQEDSLSEPYLIKRVIGLPGEQVTIRHNEVYINGNLIEQNFIDQEQVKTYCYASSDLNTCSFNIPLDAYFVLGDNRDGQALTNAPSGYSIDSRTIGPVSVDNIYGKVIFKFKDYNLLN